MQVFDKKFEVLPQKDENVRVHILRRYKLDDSIIMTPVYEYDLGRIIYFTLTNKEYIKLHNVKKIFDIYKEYYLKLCYTQIDKNTIIEFDQVCPHSYINSCYDVQNVDDGLRTIGVYKEAIPNGWFRRLTKRKIRYRYVIKYLLFTAAEDLNFYPCVKHVKRHLHYRT